MKALDVLLNIAIKKSGQETVDQFMTCFESSGFKEVLNLPNIDYEFINNEAVSKPIWAYCHFNHEETFQELFNWFVRSASHANPLGHFRSYPDFYSQVYATPRYFSFHGDGNCFAVSMIFQGFIKKVLNKDIMVRYGTLPSREYMHTYCEFDTWYSDADQKTLMLRELITKDKPKGFIYSLLSFSGFDIYDQYSLHDRLRLFPAMTHEFLSDFYMDPQPEIYKKVPSLANLKDGFQQVYKKYSEEVRLDKDDYAWKKLYRDAVSNLVGEHELPFFSQLDQPYPIYVPSNASFKVGFSTSDLPQEVFDLSCVYFGRIPGVISQTVKANLPSQIEAPDFPWMISVKEYWDKIIINNVSITPLKSRCGRFGIIGMGDLEKVHSFSEKVFKFTIQLQQEACVEVVFPVNAQAIASGLIQLKQDM